MDLLTQILNWFLFGFFFATGWWTANRILNKVFG